MKSRTWATLFGLLIIECFATLVGRRMGWPTGAVVGGTWGGLLLGARLTFVDAERWQRQYRRRFDRTAMHVHYDPDTGKNVPCWDRPCHFDLWFGEEAS